LLPDGRVLIAGGKDAAGNALASADLFNADGSVSAAPPMAHPRYGHSAIFLMDGYVLVAGGHTTGGGVTNTAELFDPLSNTWQTLPGTMTDARADFTMSQLQDGDVLVVAGDNGTSPVSSFEKFSLTANTFQYVGTLASARKAHAAAALNDGRVIIAGGSGLDSSSNAVALTSTDIYDPVANSFSAGPSLNTARFAHTATTLIDGTVLLAGGNDGTNDLASTEIYDPDAGTITASAASLATARSGHTALLLPNNNSVLIAGGTSAGTDLASTELYQSWNHTFLPNAPMSTARTGAVSSAVATDGVALLTGGSNQSSTELYGFATVKTDAADYAPGSVVTITGSGWKPGETVTLTLTESPLTDTHGPLTAVADANGNLLNNQFIPDSHDLNTKFTVAAVGAGSGFQAQNTFTDAPAVKNYSATVSPTSDSAGNSNNYQIAVLNCGGGLCGTGNDSDANQNISTFTIAVPTGFSITSPISLVAPGGQLWNSSLTGSTITLSATGGNKLTPGQSLAVKFSATASCTAGTYPWVTAVSGSFNLIGTQPSTVINGSCNVPTTLTLNSVSPNSVPFGSTTAPSFQATLTRTTGGAGVSGATISFTVDGNAAGSGTTNASGVVTVSSFDPSVLSVGSHNVQATFGGSNLGGANYLGATSGTQTLTVAKADQTITFGALGTKSYGDVPFTVSATGGASGNPVTFTASPATACTAGGTNGSTITITGAGTCTVTAHQAGNTNYNAATDVPQSFTVNKATLNVTADAKSRPYGDANPALTYAITGFVNSDTQSVVSGSPILTTTANATSSVAGSPYTIAVAIGTLTATNYTFNLVNGQLTVTPAAATITGNDSSRNYGDANSTFGFSPTGLKNSETSAVFTTQPTCTTTATTASPVSPPTYPITCSGAAAANYTFTYVAGALTINKRPVTVTADAQTKIYGDSDPALTYKLTTGSLVNGDTFTGSLARATGESVAGSPYPINQGTLALSNNYLLTYVGANLTITPAPLTVTATAQSKHYGDPDPSPLPYNATGFKFTDTAATVLTGSLARNPGENVAGSPYAITQGTLAANSNYTINFTGANLTILPATLNVAATAQVKHYGDSDPSPLPYTATGFKFTDTVATVLTGVLSRAPGENVAGSPYAITQGTLAANSNYTISFTGTNLTILPATLAVATDHQSKHYGDPDPALTYSATGFKFSDTAATVLTGSLTRNPGESVAGSPYAITQGTLAANANYTISFTVNSLTITPATLTVAADHQTKQYGDPEPVLTYSATGFKFSDTVATVLTGSLTRGAGETVAGSPYAISQGSLVSNQNYIISFTGNSLTITPAALTAAADHQTKEYGSTDPALSYTATGFKFSDTSATVLSGALARAAGENVPGPYAITQGSLVANSNYTITFTGNNLTITPAPLTVTANPQTKEYGSTDPALSYTATGFKFSDTAATVLSGALARTAGENVPGPYVITQGSLVANSNYTVIFSGNSLTITPAPLTIAADAQTKHYGDNDPTLTYTLSGLKFSDTGASVLSGSLARTAGENVPGPYAITQGSLVANSNYIITFAGNSLTITPATLMVAADPQTKQYGAADPALTYTATGFKFSDTAATVLSGALTRTAGENVPGPYVITQGSLVANSNYTITFSGNSLTITPATLTIAADAQTKHYGDNDPTLTYTVSGLKFSDTGASVLSGSLTRTAGESVASSPYAITQGSLVANSNYTITFTGNSLIITAAPLTVTANPKTKEYGSTDPALTYTASGFKLSDTAATVLTGSLVRATGETVLGGPYAISQGTLVANSNYAVTFNGSTLTITPKPASVTPGPASKTYGDPDSALSGTLSGFLPADNVTATYSRTAGETVAGNPYTISASLSPAGVLSNYSITYNTAVFTINKAQLTVTVDNKAMLLNGVVPTLTGTITGIKLSDPITATYSTLANGAAVGTFPITATLNDPAGKLPNYNVINNSGSLTVSYATGSLCYGDYGHQILQPINANGTSVFKQGSTTPAKFRVCDAKGVSIGTPGVVSSFFVGNVINGTIGAVDETVDSTTPDSAFRWDPTAQQWIFNISTKTLNKNATYVFQIKLNDGSMIQFQYGLR
jgi:hypothetical protein